MNTINAELNIEDVMALVDYNWRMFQSIPESMYENKNMAGSTFRDTAIKYKGESEKWEEILNRTWPQ